MLEIKNLFSGYDELDIIKNINIEVNRGETLCIIGPNGSGKSTLLKAMANLLDYRGNIKIDGKEVNKLSRVELAKKIALMSQISQIYFPYSVYDTVAIGRYAHSTGVFKSLDKEDRNIVIDIIKKVGLYDIKDKMINELSGGQLQRVFLAKTLAQDPDIILLDEPTNHLDLKYQIELLGYLYNWAIENNKIVIGVLHDLNLVQNFGNNVAILHNGELVSYGETNKTLNGKVLEKIYDIDIKGFMIETLEKWKEAK